MTRNCSIVNDQSNANCDVGNETVYNTEVSKSYLCHYNDTYILVRGDTVITTHNIPTQVAFKSCAVLTKWIKQVDGTTIDDIEDLDLVMSIYNLIEYC